MDLNYQQHVPTDFPAESRVWIYQSSRLFSIAEALELEKDIELFLADWQTHGAANKGYANLFFGQFLVIMADETHQKISGCSTDSSVRFVKEIEKGFSVKMFDRSSLAFIVNDKVQLLPLAQLNYALENKFIDTDTLYFNNLVATKEQWLHQWIVPVKNSWLASRLPEQAL
ncbi:hypothetical protein [Arachidicoccus sp.]|uniref:hypothetical protein n=1 Tax=Arachidicoccus sp. TaxID=1872624 RepID=UPI003D25B247